MAKRTINADVAIYYRFRVTFDDQSPEFTEALESYITSIHSDGTLQTMLQHCLYNLTVRRSREVEGVGVIEVDGNNTSNREFPSAGISMETEDDEVMDYTFEEVD